jgi:hypothetical protein
MRRVGGVGVLLGFVVGGLCLVVGCGAGADVGLPLVRCVVKCEVGPSETPTAVASGGELRVVRTPTPRRPGGWFGGLESGE